MPNLPYPLTLPKWKSFKDNYWPKELLSFDCMLVLLFNSLFFYTTEDRWRNEVFGLSWVDGVVIELEAEGFSGLNEEASYFFFYFS